MRLLLKNPGRTFLQIQTDINLNKVHLCVTYAYSRDNCISFYALKTPMLQMNASYLGLIESLINSYLPWLVPFFRFSFEHFWRQRYCGQVYIYTEFLTWRAFSGKLPRSTFASQLMWRTFYRILCSFKVVLEAIFCHFSWNSSLCFKKYVCPNSVKLPSVKSHVVYFLTIYFPRKEFKVLQEFDIMGVANIMSHHIS